MRLHKEQKTNTDELASSHSKSKEIKHPPSFSSNNAQLVNIKHTKQNNLLF
jgi:hypothetical protein